jgi:hypothetical protein
VVGGEVGVDDVKVAVQGRVDGGIGVAPHETPDASEPVADREREFVGVLVAQRVEEFQGSVKGAMLGEFGQATMDCFGSDRHSGLLSH